jgi:DNA-binding NarL/FixJ family response regulator
VSPLRVLVVGADPLSRAGLAALLSGRAELAVVGEVSADEVASAPPHEAVAFDVGPAAGERLRFPAGAPLLALAADEHQAAEASRAGARAVIFRSASPASIAAGLVAVARGLSVLDPSLAAAWLRPPEAPEGSEVLTPREREVLDLLAEGLPNRAIAARLGISEHTAKFHVNAILGKLGVESRAEAIVRAARLGMVVL